LDERAVRLHNVSKFYARTVALDCIDLDIRRGEFFSLLGPSGCGKTTTLRLIAGFEQPTTGTIEIAGKSVLGQPAYRRNVNTVFQNYSLFPHLSVSENIAFGPRRKGSRGAELEARVQAALQMVQMEELAARRPQELSGGQQQRVALARALINRPEVLLLDEPMAALDSKLRKELRAGLKRLQRESGITFVLVTHDQEEALTLSDRLAVVHRGRVEQVATPREIYDRPSTRFVASFIGTANFLPVEVVDVVNGKTRVQHQGGSFWAPSRPGSAIGDRLELALRPEQLSLRRTPDDENNAMPCTLIQTIFMGPVTRYELRGEGGACLVAERQSGVGEEVTVGESLYVTWGSQHGSLLRAEEL
jgi:spermidine/putrescine transport system ATP-binding protein